MTFDFAAARLNMVESQMRTSDVTDHQLVEAFRQVARETLCPADKAKFAYADAEVAYGPGLWLMRPRDVAKILQTVRPRAGERALAIAAPYAAAVMEAMGLSVDRLDEGDLKTPSGRDYAVIVSEGAVDRVPSGWLAALAEGGRLAAVERSGPVGKARLYLKTAQGAAAREVFDSSPHLLPGFEPELRFAF